MQKTSHIISLIFLAALAALINTFAPTIYFNNQLMLGGSIGVFALLAFGWPGLLVGVAALVVTALRWGHPFELIIGTLFLVWLKIFLDRFNGGHNRQDNGRIVIAAIGFWLLAGLPLEFLLFHHVFGIDTVKSMTLGLKESVIGVVNSTLALLFYIIFRYRAVRRSEITIPIRGVTFVTVLLAIIVPAILIMLINSRDLRSTMLDRHNTQLRAHALSWAFALPAPSEQMPAPNLAFRWDKPDGTTRTSNPELIQKLSEKYVIERPNRTRNPELDLYVPRAPLPVLLADSASYWGVTIDLASPEAEGEPGGRITAYEPALSLIDAIDTELALPGFLILLVLLIAGALLSEILSMLVDRQFKRVLETDDEQELGSSRIRELDQLAGMINTHNQRVAELNAALNSKQRTAYDLTENIPVGTYTMIQPPDGGLAYFSFMSTRFLELTGLDRDEARSDPMKAFACVHPDDQDEWIRKNIEVFEKKLPFCEECRLIVKGEVRWIAAESRPRDMDDGSVVWEGVLIDITDRKIAEQKLADANFNMRLAAQATRLGFWDYNVETDLDVWDENMCRIHGLTPDEFDGKWKRFIHPDDYEDVMTETQRMLASDRIFVMDYRIVRADGQVRHVREHGMVIRDDRGRALRAHGTMFDITDAVMAAQRERELEQSYRKNLESKLKSSLAAAAIGHEINTPLSTLLLQSRQSQIKGGATPEELDVIAREAQHVLRIIEKMKVLMRNVQTDHHPVNLREVVDSALLQVERALQDQDIELSLRESPDKSFTIPGDDAQIQIAITNLLRNAIEALADTDPQKPREILIQLDRTGDEVRLTIGDSGPGWSGAELEELPLTTTKEDGTGIGLYLVRTTVSNHGARLTFGTSSLGGAEVALIFPAAI